MRTGLRIGLLILVVGGAVLALAARSRIARVTNAVAEIPVHPGAREGGGRARHLPRLLSWDDPTAARVRRVFALAETTSLSSVARHAHPALAARGWYLVDPGEIERMANPQVIVWQRDPDERLDLTQLWPVAGMSREQRLYGGIFPPEFLDAPQVIEWNYALGGPRLTRAIPSGRTLIR